MASPQAYLDGARTGLGGEVPGALGTGVGGQEAKEGGGTMGGVGVGVGVKEKTLSWLRELFDREVYQEGEGEVYQVGTLTLTLTLTLSFQWIHT